MVSMARRSSWPRPRRRSCRHDDDVVLGGLARVLAGLDGILLGRQAEGVVAQAVQHVLAEHPVVPGIDVGGDVAQRVADVQARAAGVGEHVEDEQAAGRVCRNGLRVGPGTGRVGGVEGALAPPTDPARRPRSGRPGQRCSGTGSRPHIDRDRGDHARSPRTPDRGQDLPTHDEGRQHDEHTGEQPQRPAGEAQRTEGDGIQELSQEEGAQTEEEAGLGVGEQGHIAEQTTHQCRQKQPAGPRPGGTERKNCGDEPDHGQWFGPALHGRAPHGDGHPVDDRGQGSKQRPHAPRGHGHRPCAGAACRTRANSRCPSSIRPRVMTARS
jgi:hypothetical protein